MKCRKLFKNPYSILVIGLAILVIFYCITCYKDYLHVQKEREKGNGVRLAHSLLVVFEGHSHKCYKDNRGKIAIGHGFTDKKPQSCLTTEHDSSMRLWEDIIDTSNFIDQYVFIDITSQRRAGLITFIFNIGRQGFLNSKALVEINNENWENARLIMLEWKVKTKKYRKGLAKRRQIEADLML